MIYLHLIIFLFLHDSTGNWEVSGRSQSFHTRLLQQPGVSGLQSHLSKVRAICLIFLFSGSLATHWLTSRLSCDTRYTARPYKKTVIHVQPPFLRPEIDRQMPVKVRDNGIQSQDLQNKVWNVQIRHQIQITHRQIFSHAPSKDCNLSCQGIKSLILFFLLPANLSRSCRAVRHQTTENSTAAATKARPQPAEEPTIWHRWYCGMTLLHAFIVTKIPKHSGHIQVYKFCRAN